MNDVREDLIESLQQARLDLARAVAAEDWDAAQRHMDVADTIISTTPDLERGVNRVVWREQDRARIRRMIQRHRSHPMSRSVEYQRPGLTAVEPE